MAAIRSFLYLIVILVIVAIALVFCFRNTSSVPVDFLLFQSASLSIGFWVLASFLVGSLLGWLMAVPGWFGLKIQSKRRGQQLQTKQKELVRLKGESAK